MTQRRIIGFLTIAHPQDRSSWSGTYYYMGEALQRRCGDVVYLGPLDTRLVFVGKFLSRLCHVLFRKKYDYQRSFWYSKRVSALAKKSISAQPLDCIFAPASAPALACLKKSGIPIFYVSDTTFELLIDYYPSFSNHLSMSISAGHQVERAALHAADIVSFPSRWAADSAIEAYGVSPENVKVIPFGANLDKIAPRSVALNRRPSGQCRLLFIGVDWLRKGGDIALEALVSLEENHGISAHLTVCGCHVPAGVSHERMTVVGFLDKRDARKAEQLSRLFSEADYLLLPTRAECFGMVFAEASSYGVPSISTRTGGTSGAVVEGNNGYLLPEEARGGDYADLIAALEVDDENYAELCRRTRHEYETRINWDAWARDVDVLIDGFQR